MDMLRASVFLLVEWEQVCWHLILIAVDMLPKCQLHDSSQRLCPSSLEYSSCHFELLQEGTENPDHACKAHRSSSPSGKMGSKTPCQVIMLKNREADSALSVGRVSKSMSGVRRNSSGRGERRRRRKVEGVGVMALRSPLMLTSLFPLKFFFLFK